ncbi:hypothetical protein M9H77_22056 [Catharanthus roseus]|uniref:Uncharacterized protein n=1 Tax=Catharanthus roseus TaxID=4058 RepID=A0ACC0AS16_CATRO|nr:hypothetical protein M9H77_22056 [Catharanthus roseus]
MKNAGKAPKASKIGGKAAVQDIRSDKKSGTGMNGSPKKGGRGGKYTWSGDGYSEAELGGLVAIDANDPNFEDPEE